MAKNILVTGASSGIGEATARFLLEQGNQVVLVARNAEKLERLVSEYPTKAYAKPFDLTNLEQIEEIFEFCKENNILLDGLVHCAGIVINEAVRVNNIDSMRNIFKINYEAFVEMVKYYSNRKYSEKGGSIVVLSSLAAQVCKQGNMNCSASKAAVNVAVRVMSKELQRRMIRVNSIMPGYVKTPMLTHIDDFYNTNGQQPLGLIEPEYITYLIEFLLSDQAKYITGAHIPVSGGMNYYEV